MAGDGIEIACAHMARRFAPRFEGRAGSGYSSVYVCRCALSDPGNHLAGGRVGAVEVVAARRLAPLAANVEAERLVSLHPFHARFARLRRWAVLHCLEDIC